MTEHKKTIVIASLVVLLLASVTGLMVWVYTGSITPAKAKIVKALPLPAAIIDYKIVKGSDLLAHMDLAESVVGGKDKLSNEERKMAYDQFLSGKKVEMLAKMKGVAATQGAIEDEYKSMVSHYTSDNADEFAQQLKDNYQMTPEQFKSKVLAQDISLNNLALWFHSQESLNRESYEKARKILDKSESGTKFEDVAREFGGDNTGKAFAGDEGFVSMKDLLPEFQETLSKANQDQILLAPSRYGLHVIKLLGKSDGPDGVTQLHLQQVFVDGSGFEKWYKGVTDSMKTFKLLKVA